VRPLLVAVAIVLALAACRTAPTAPCADRRVVVGRDTLRVVCDHDGRSIPVPTPPTAP
jgi:hypothetical protein